MNKIKIAVIGLGYVGLPLAVNLGKYFNVVGLDKDKLRIRDLKKKKDVNNEISRQEFLTSKNLNFFHSETAIKDCNVFIITVPTPINKKNLPDLSLINSAAKLVSKFLKKKDVVVFESTVFPGYTEEVAVPILEKNSRLSFLKDFHCGYSPERINPGDKFNKITKIKKIISASSISTLNQLQFIYGKIIKAGLYKAESIKIAEAAKVIENVQRDINIAFVNELVFIFNKLDINTKKVLQAASTKWNFLNFAPGFVGGHCVSVDPYYLNYISKKKGYSPRLLTNARKINNTFQYFVAKKILKMVKFKKLPKILILGLTFKENCNDIRNSKVIEMIDVLKKKKIHLSVFDPLVNKKKIKLSNVKFLRNLKTKEKFDLIVICVKHNYFKKKISFYESMLKTKDSLIFDVKNLFKNINNKKIKSL